MAPRGQQPVGQLVRRKLAVLCQLVAPGFRQAFDAGLDRDAAPAPEQLQHLGLPQIDPRLHAELESEADKPFEQRAVGQKDLVDKVDVLHSLRAK